MTDVKCPLTQMWVEEFIHNTQRTSGLVLISAELLREFVRDSFEEGDAEGFERGCEFGARGHYGG